MRVATPRFSLHLVILAAISVAAAGCHDSTSSSGSGTSDTTDGTEGFPGPGAESADSAEDGFAGEGLGDTNQNSTSDEEGSPVDAEEVANDLEGQPGEGDGDSGEVVGDAGEEEGEPGEEDGELGEEGNELICEAGARCPNPAPGAPDVGIVKVVGGTPALTGGVASAGDYELVAVDLYVEEMLVSSNYASAVLVRSLGNTFGAVRIEKSAWGVVVNLDTELHITFASDPFAVQHQIVGGGCFSVAEGIISADIRECTEQEPQIVSNGAFAYEASPGLLKLLVSFPNDPVIASFPPDFVGDPAGLITGNLVYLLTFESISP